MYDVFCGQILQIYFCSTLVCLEAAKIINQDNGPSRGVQSMTEDTEQPGAASQLSGLAANTNISRVTWQGLDIAAI